MERIRLATPEEVESIKPVSDLDEGCVVFALRSPWPPQEVGLGVRRICCEIDPMITPDSWSTKSKALFMRDLETVAVAQGIKSFYFNVDAEDKAWQHFMKEWGAEQVSNKPMLRFKRTL